MKKYCILFTVLVLTMALLTACGCTAQKNPQPTMPTMPPKATTPTVPATSEPTMPVTTPSMPEDAMPETSEDATGGMTDATGDITDSTGPNAGDNARQRRMR